MLNNQINFLYLKRKKATDYQLPEGKKTELLVYIIVYETQCTLYPQSQSKQNPSG